MKIRSRLLLGAVTCLGALSSRVSGFLPGVGSDAFLPNLGLDIAAPRIIGFLEEHFGSNASSGFPAGLFRRLLPAGDFSYDFERFREKDYGPAHFDNEYLEEGQNHLLKLRSEMIAILLSDRSYAGTDAGGRRIPVEKARVWLGRQLHTLQDFYAHSNWVEMGRTTISPVVGRPGAVIYPKTPLNEPTCTEYCINPSSLSAAARTLYLAMHTCYRNCFAGDQSNYEVAMGRACAVTCSEPDSFCHVSDGCEGHACSNNTIEMERVTTGYYRTNGDPNSIEPSGKCSHGGLSDAGAKGVEGINKDSTLQTYSPHWFLHRTAATLAIAHTGQYLADLLQDWPTVTIGNVSYPQPKVPERHLRLLFGLNPGSIAFVIDRSRSMATSLPAVKGAVRAVVTCLQNMGYLPFQWVLVGYGQSYDTVVTVTSDINVFLQELTLLAVDTTNSCLQERYWEGLVHAARNSLERSQVFVFTDQPASNLPNPGAAYNEFMLSLQRETRELERERLFYIHVLELPNEAGYPYFEHPWPECGLTPSGTRSQDMGFLSTYISGHAIKLRPQSRANMMLEMATIITDITFNNYNTAATEYKDEVYNTGNRQATDAATREIVVDSTVYFIRIYPSDRGQDGSIGGDVTVQRPDGTTVTPLEDSDVVHVNYRAGSGNYHQLLIPDPQPGTWKFTRMAPSTFMSAEVASAISFSFDFVEWDAAGPHAGWITKPDGYYFSPYSWSLYRTSVVTVKARVDGPVGSVDVFHLRTKDSCAIIMAMNLTRVDSFRGGDEGEDGGLGNDYVLDQERIYMGFLNTSTFPFCGDFHATVSGTDEDRVPFTRRDPGYIESGLREPNWGRPRSPGCPPLAVPPVLVDISTFPSTSASTTSSVSSATIAPPLTTSTSSSSSSNSTSSSSFTSSSASSTVSSTSGSLSATSTTSIVSSESISSNIASNTGSSSLFDSSTLSSASSSGSAWSSSSSGVISSQVSSASDSWSTTSSKNHITPISVPPSSSSSDGQTASMSSGQSSSLPSVSTTQSSFFAPSSAISSSSGTSITTSAAISSESQSSVTSYAASESSGSVGSSNTITATVISSLVVSWPSSSLQSVSASSSASLGVSSRSQDPSGSLSIPSSNSDQQGSTTPTLSSSTSTTSQSGSTGLSNSAVDPTSTSVNSSSEQPSKTGSASSTVGKSTSSSFSSATPSSSSSGAISVTDFTSSATALPASASSTFPSSTQTAPSSTSTRTRSACRARPGKLKKKKKRSAHALRKREKVAKPTGRNGVEV
ncbi:hypothetical protein QBC37DRAFT_457274 [Rhypophila decipiens]|uniref:VWFA domain-containing protein n=1 Tax=Rhypophila decipiens TaxID=261697 RepID=A0AAN6YKL2_9PEZI|nr:hypothetical protein QBC37DRAFT_457274 [Rhypophila decipiens]